METSPRLSLPYVLPQQAQKHVTVNETVRRLDALVQLSVLSRTQTSEPASPAEGDAYILSAGKTGAAWALMSANSIAAFQDGAWAELTPKTGWFGWVTGESKPYFYNGAAWAAFSAPPAEAAAKFGVNATADATSRLSVKSDAALFSHDDETPGSGDHRLKINKSAAGKTASLILQDNFSGRAELGLAGDDDFRVKVSADGATWLDALSIARSTGAVSMLLRDTPFFDYQTGANQSLGASGAWQKLTNFTGVRSGHADFSTSNNRYTATKAGPHLFLGQIVQTPAAATNSIGAFAKNGSPSGNWIIHPVAAGVQDFMLISTIFNLAVGDYVEFFLFTLVSTTINAGYTSFGGFRL